MCETMNPNVPAGSMGEIKFPQNGEYGSGDVIATPVPKKKKRVHKQKPAQTVMNFDEFVKSNK